MKHLLLFTTLLIMFSSCEKDGGAVLEDTDVTFSFVVSDMNRTSDGGGASVASLTRTVDATMAIDNLWVLQYDETDVLVTNPAYLANLGLTSDGAGVKVVLKNMTNSTVYFIANTYDRTLLSGLTQDVSVDILKMTCEKVQLNLPAGNSNIMPMLGSYTGGTGGATLGTSGKVNMTRLFAKVTFDYKVGADLQLVGEQPNVLGDDQNNSLVIKGMKLWNVPTTVDIFTPTSTDGADGALKSVFEEPDGVQPAKILKTTVLDGSDSIGTVTFYMPENISGIVNTSGVNDFKLSSDKFHDFDADGLIDSKQNPVVHNDKKPAYIELTGRRVFKSFNHTISADGVMTETRADSSQVVTFRVYLGNPPLSGPGAVALYNDFNVNANRSYTISATIDRLNPTDKRIDFSAPPELIPTTPIP